MTAAYKLKLETETALRLKEKLREEFADDAELARDTIEGETDLHQTIEWAAREMLVANAMADGIKELILQMSERQGRFLMRAQKLRDAIESAMMAGEIKKLELAAVTLSISAGGQPKVIITDEAAIPSTFLRHPPPEPDKAAIKAALLGGTAIPGAVLANPMPHLNVRKT